jgi:GNAT superfamily N-acetyltransferase
MTVEIRRVAPADRGAFATIVNEVLPENPTSVENMAWQDETYPGGIRLLATVGGTPVGCAHVGRIYMFQADFDAYWGDIAVLPAARHRGVGSELFAAISDAAREAGKTHLHIPASEARPESIAFLAHRGFSEYDRWKVLQLDLATVEVPAVEPPEGVAVTSLQERPDLVESVHRVARATFRDIPTGGEPLDAAPIDEFRARDVDRAGIPKGGFAVAVDQATGEAIGYASLMFLPGSSTRAYHDMTAVIREWRGRGVGRALKQATIAWAKREGLESLETGNEERNAAMRALNEQLGYRERPNEITFRGPVAAARIDA